MIYADYINLCLLFFTSIGVIIAIVQIKILTKQKRADMVLQLYNQFCLDVDMKEVYYKLEYHEFVYDINFHNSKEEKRIDKLLGFFDSICKLRMMNLIKDKDLSFIKYELQTVYYNEEVQKYLIFLDSYFKLKNVSEMKFDSFRNVCSRIFEVK